MSQNDADLVRTQLHQLVGDVEPAPGALPKLLSATRRRHRPWRPVLLLSGAAVAAVALLFALVVPSTTPPSPQPVSIAPNSYLAQVEPGVIASFDVISGRQIAPVVRIPGAADGPLVADGERIYTVASGADLSGIVEVTPNGAPRVVDPTTRVDALAAGAGRVAYSSPTGVVIAHNGAKHAVAVQPGRRVDDLAFSEDGRLAVLISSDDAETAGVYVMNPEATELPAAPITRPKGCGPWAISWSGTDVAALSSVDCQSSGMVRVATFDSRDGEQVGAGVPFDVSRGPLDAAHARLSTDRLGRFLVSGASSQQWLVDGADVRSVPVPCAPGGECAQRPGIFWS